MVRALWITLSGLLTCVVIGAIVLSDSALQANVVGSAVAALQLVEDIRQTLDGEGVDVVAPGPVTLAIGPASGDVTATSALIWARASGQARLVVDYAPESIPDGRREVTSGLLLATDDFAGTVTLSGLSPDTRYQYRVWAERDGEGRSAAIPGQFRTALATGHGSVSFVFAGDLGGGGYCREGGDGYRIFQAMREVRSDFFLALGDMIYADNTCPALRPGGGANLPGRYRDVDSRFVDWNNRDQLREVYFAHWRYNRSDPHQQAFLASTPMYAMWDDHEVINNSGGSWTHWDAANAGRDGYRNLVDVGREAFLAYTPVARHGADPHRLYRSFSRGPDLDVFLLDTRSHRSRNDAPDSENSPKTMLGVEQLQWLQSEVVRSTATWKVIVTSVTLSVPSGGAAAPILGRDGWANGVVGDDPTATGFERELQALVTFFDQARIANLVFVSADTHRALAIVYDVDPDRDGVPLRFHEFVAGPLAATPGSGRPTLDPTFNPTLLYGEGNLFNFGVIRIEPDPTGGATLTFEIRDEAGVVRPGSTIPLRSTARR